MIVPVTKHHWRYLFICLSAILLSTSIEAQQATIQVGDIRISGNEVTQEKFILRWSGLARGQQIDPGELQAARQRIQNTGLFKRVSINPIANLENASTTLSIELEEKSYTLIYPRLGRNSDGDIKTGIRLQMDNINGADQSLRITAETEDAANGDVSDEVNLRYQLPLFKRPYELSWAMDWREKATSREDFDNIEYRQFVGIRVARDYPLPSFARDLQVAISLGLEDRTYDEPYPDDIEAETAGQFNRLGLSLEYDRVNRQQYRREGNLYYLLYEQGFDWLGSDFDSRLLTLEMRGYRPRNLWDNINYRLELGSAWDAPFDYPRFGLGGSSNVRGLESFDGRGDARFFTNIEYVFGYARYPTFRNSLFVDAGNVYDSFNDIDLSDLQYTVGAGVRWKLQSFVKTDLFIDYGYDVDTADNKFYGGTRLAF